MEHGCWYAVRCNVKFVRALQLNQIPRQHLGLLLTVTIFNVLIPYLNLKCIFILLKDFCDCSQIYVVLKLIAFLQFLSLKIQSVANCRKSNARFLPEFRYRNDWVKKVIYVLKGHFEAMF